MPFFALAVISCAVTFVVQRHTGAVQPLGNLSIALRIENAFVAYAWYLGKMLWPAGLAVPYLHPGEWPVFQVGCAVALVAGLCGFAVWLRRRLPFIAMGWFWFLGTLVPVIGLVQVGGQSFADRYTYVPLIGVFLALTWGTEAMLGQRGTARLAAIAAAAAVLGACAVRTREQLGYWQDSEKLLRHTFTLTGDNWLAYFGLGFDQFGKGRVDEALENYKRALRLNPDSSAILKNLGDAFSKEEQFPMAIECFESALRLRPDDPDTHSNLGAALDKSGRDDEAIQQYVEALRLAPDSALAHFRLGSSLVKAGRSGEAIEHFRQAARDKSGYSEAMNNLGVALFNQGRSDEAIEQFRRVLQREPDHASTHLNLANALAARGKWAGAAEHYREAVRLKADLLDARYGLARALTRVGQRDEAIQQLKEMLRLKPDHARAKQLLHDLGASESGSGQ